MCKTTGVMVMLVMETPAMPVATPTMVMLTPAMPMTTLVVRIMIIGQPHEEIARLMMAWAIATATITLGLIASADWGGPLPVDLWAWRI